MPLSGRPDVRVFETPYALAEGAAVLIAEALRSVIGQGSEARLVLAGGSTPEATYRTLASDHRDRLDWTRVAFFWGDERCVPRDDPQSNERMSRSTLLTPLGIDERNVHPLRCEGEPEASAHALSALLRQFVHPDRPLFDVTLLGLGEDGHTASLFPSSPALNETERLVASAHAPPSSPVRDRLTLTYPALAQSKLVLFLVAGEAKRQAFADALAGKNPAGRVRAERVVWLVDRAAAEDAT